MHSKAPDNINTAESLNDIDLQYYSSRMLVYS